MIYSKDCQFPFSEQVLLHIWTISMGKCKARTILMRDIQSTITTFEVKLHLWEAQLANSQLVHFSLFTACVLHDMDLDNCPWYHLSAERIFLPFPRTRKIVANCKLFSASFDFLMNEATTLLNMESVQLQCNDNLRVKFHTSTLSFFQDLVPTSDKYSNYTEYVQGLMVKSASP